MKIEIYKGVPVRYLDVETIEGMETTITVSTETVGLLLETFFDYDDKGDEHIEEMDNSIDYYIDDNVFTVFTDEDVVKYINENIDDYYKGLTQS